MPKRKWEGGHIATRVAPHVQARLNRRRALRSWHSAIGMEVDGGNNRSINEQAKAHEARMVPGLGNLEWGFPNSIVTTLRYVQGFQSSVTDGSTGSLIFRANGIYDPDYTNAGHQPMYRDQWAAIYDYYTVLGSKIKVTFVNTSATVNGVVGIQGSDTPSLSSTSSTWMEQNNGVHEVLGNINSGPISLFMTYSPQENLGASMKDDQSSLVAIGSDPGSQQAYYFGILYSGITVNTTEDFTFDYLVEVEYTVKFTTLTKQTGS